MISKYKKIILFYIFCFIAFQELNMNLMFVWTFILQAQYMLCFIIFTSSGYWRKFSKTGLRLYGFWLPSDGKSQVYD